MIYDPTVTPSVAVREKLSRSIKLKSANPPPFYISRVSLYPPPSGWMRGGEEKRFFLSLVVFFGGPGAFIIITNVCVCRVLPFIYLFIITTSGQIDRPDLLLLRDSAAFYSNQFELEIQPPRVTRNKKKKKEKGKMPIDFLFFFFALC